MTRLKQLLEPDYRPCEWDLKRDAAGRAYWTDLFRWHLDRVLAPLIKTEYAQTGAEQLAAFEADYRARFDEIDARPESFDRLDVLFFTHMRREVCIRHGFADPFATVKQHANEAALKLLPGVLAEMDAADEAARRELLVRGLMAGNVFDLGSRATADRPDDGNAAFRQTRARQPARPWRFDDVDAWWRRWDEQGGYQHVVFFVDNAGGDTLLGCLPWARWMIATGARVTLAANTGPALNDVTASELRPLVQQCAEMDAALRAALDRGRLDVQATGCVTPLIDLAALNAPFVEHVTDADLMILHGMGRGVESNFAVQLSCDALHTAVLKDEAVAARAGGRVFDCVFRFRQGG